MGLRDHEGIVKATFAAFMEQARSPDDMMFLLALCESCWATILTGSMTYEHSKAEEEGRAIDQQHLDELRQSAHAVVDELVARLRADIDLSYEEGDIFLRATEGNSAAQMRIQKMYQAQGKAQTERKTWEQDNDNA